MASEAPVERRNVNLQGIRHETQYADGEIFPALQEQENYYHEPVSAEAVKPAVGHLRQEMKAHPGTCLSFHSCFPCTASCTLRKMLNGVSWKAIHIMA